MARMPLLGPVPSAHGGLAHGAYSCAWFAHWTFALCAHLIIVLWRNFLWQWLHILIFFIPKILHDTLLALVDSLSRTGAFGGALQTFWRADRLILGRGGINLFRNLVAIIEVNFLYIFQAAETFDRLLFHFPNVLCRC